MLGSGGNKRKFSEASKFDNNGNIKKGRTCYNCGKKGHYKRECRFLKKQRREEPNINVQNSSKANLVEQEPTELIAMLSELRIGMLTELHMASVSKTDEWWYDSGATVHVCNNETLFKDYKVMNGCEVLMGNNDSAKVIGEGSVELQFTSGKRLMLVNVLHVPDIRKNLVSASLLCKKGFKTVLDSDKLILFKNGLFVGKGYSCNGMFKLSVNNNKVNASA